MAAEERWYFTKQQLSDTPNRKCGIDPDRELSYRQQAANFIQDMGQRLQVNQLCINTAIVYMHRFYMFHTFTKFHRNAISTCALFLAAKVEEQPRKLEHVIKVAHICLHREAPPLDTKSEAYLEQAQELVINENIMLQTLGFDVAIDHPHTHVVKCCQLVRGGSTSIHQHHASKDLAQTSYFMATNSLHLTTMCLQYKPTVVACVCIHLACKWGNWEIPMSSEGRKWFFYVDKTVTEDLLEELTTEFLAILDRCPSRLKRKMMSANTGGEFSEMNCEALTQATMSRSSMSLTINSLGSVNKSDKFGEKNQDRERSSSSRSGSSHKPSAAGSEKNGGVAQDRKERIKKEPHNNSFANAASSVDSNQQAELASPAKSELIKVANSTDAAAQLSATDGSHSSVKKVRADGSSSKSITPKEYQEYRERSKREKEKVKQIGLADKSRITPVASSAATVAVKQGKTNGIEKETMMQEVIINSTSLSSVNLQPVVSLTHLDLAKFKNAKHFQLSAGSSSNVAKQFVKIDGFPTTDPAFSSTSSSLVPGAIPGSFAAVSVKRTPEEESRGGGSNLLSKSTPINPVTNDSISQSVASILGSILTPSPPSAKDGFTFSMDDMAVFTSPSELLVPVTPVEPEPVEASLDSNKMLGLGGKSEHKKQRATEDSKTNLSSPPLPASININETNSNLISSQSEQRRKDKFASKVIVPDTLLDVKPSAFSGIESDFLNSNNSKHNSKIPTTEKSNKHHRVKKSAPSINLSHLSDSLSAGGDNFLPQQDYHMTVTADYLNQNPMFETNSESCRKSGDVHSADVFSSSSQSSSMLLSSAPASSDAKNALSVSLQEKQRHSNHVLQAQQQPPSIPIEMMFSTDKQHYETETASLAQLPPPQTSPIVKSEPSESKHSRRSLQSSSKHEKKEKRKKHDKKEKSKEHGKDKERSEEKHVPKVPKLTIPKDVLGSSSNSVKSETSEVNHKPKDESLVVKIKLGGGKSGKNGNLPEVVSNAPSTVSSETLAVKERSGLKLKFTKNPSSKESYIIGNDQESKTKDKSKDKVKESRKRSRSSTSPKTKDALSHEVMQTATIVEAAVVSQPPPAKVIKTTALAKAPKKGAAINHPINVSNSSANNNSPALPKNTGRAVAKNEQTQPNPHNNNNMIANEYNRRSQTGHERGRGVSGGGKRNSRGNSRVPPAVVTNPIHLVPPPGPVPQQMMFHAGIPPPSLYDRRGGVVGGNDAFNPFFPYDQNTFYAHQMQQHGFPNENSMFYPPPSMPGMRPPPPPHMGFPQSQFQQGQGQQRGTRDQFNRQQQQHQRSSGPPLPIQPPPRNPPPPPEN